MWVMLVVVERYVGGNTLLLDVVFFFYLVAFILTNELFCDFYP